MQEAGNSIVKLAQEFLKNSSPLDNQDLLLSVSVKALAAVDGTVLQLWKLQGDSPTNSFLKPVLPYQLDKTAFHEQFRQFPQHYGAIAELLNHTIVAEEDFQVLRPDMHEFLVENR